MRLLLLLTFLCLAPAAVADAVSEALAVFREYEARAARFDATVADLYSDDAVIVSKRASAGRVREVSFKGEKWKLMIRALMPVAKLRSDTNRFSDVQAREVGSDVVITAQRFSELKGYTSPFAIVLRKGPDGVWRIIQERSETQP